MAEKRVKIALRDNPYTVYVDAGSLDRMGNRVRQVISGCKVVIITNPVVSKLYADKLKQSLEQTGLKTHVVEVPEGEKYKSLDEATRLYDRLIDLGIQRWDGIVALGGGVIGDLAGFVAATYMRGLPLIQVPTTLLSQVDSSLGGKVAVDHPKGKNLVGCFYQPKFVLADVETLRTLPKDELKVGLAEVIKYGFISGEDFLSYLEAYLESVFDLEKEILIEVVAYCCRIKARVVEEDEKDFGRRAILNYGHTIGHAIEVLTGYKISHGEAVSIGMVCAAQVAYEMNFIDKSLLERHINLLSKAHLPTKLPVLDVSEIIEQIRLDKKAKGTSSIFVLLKGVGLPIVVDVSEELLRKALAKV